MSATGENTTSGSTSSFITALVLGSIVLGVEGAVFLWFHNRNKKVYQPRLFLAPEGKQPNELPSNPLRWFMEIWRTAPEEVLRLQGLDAFVFTRLLRMYWRMFLPFFFLTWAVLMPVTAVSPTQNQDGLNIFVIGNVGKTVQPRLAAHLIVCWVLTFWVFYLIYEEIVTFVQTRHDWISSPAHLAQARSRTVLITRIPKDMMSVDALTELATAATGSVEKVWLVRDVKEVEEVFDNRQKACTKLEGAEGKILSLAAKRVRKGKAPAPKTDSAATENGASGAMESIVPAKKRPTHRLGKVPFFGKKVDSIDHSIEEIKTDNATLEKLRAEPEKYDLATSAIIRFSSQTEAIMFSQHLEKSRAKKVGPRFPDVAPEDIIWKNLGLNSKLLLPRKAISWGLTAALILFWAIPVAFVGSLSNLSGLCASVSWLAWLCRLPSPVVGIIQGIAPPVGMAVLFILLPIFLRKMAEFEGIPLVTLVDMSVFKRYWVFLVVHGLLIVAVSGSLTSALAPAIQAPQNAPSILAAKLPQSATFFLTVLITTALSNAGKFLTQVISLAVLFVMRLLGGATPRKIYKLERTLPSTSYFQLIPNVDILLVYGLVYCILQPIITALALLAFFLYYMAFKYQFVWVYSQPPVQETNGAYFPRAITHIFVGLYIQQLCLIGLFFLSSNAAGNRSAIPEGALMIVLMVLTIAFQIWLKWKFPTKEVALDRISTKTGEKPAQGEGSPKMTNTLGQPMSEEEEHHGFEPPSMFQPMPTIWIAKDELGLATHEVEKIAAAGLAVSTDYATMNLKGKVEVSERPDFIDPNN